jgi:HSP20 family protein
MSNCQCPTGTTATRPQYRTREDENGVTLQIALPGVRKEDVKLTFHESSLRIDATRGDTVPEASKAYRGTGDIQRYALDLRLTNRLDGTKTTATIDAGVLTLRVPVREESKPRQIEVN